MYTWQKIIKFMYGNRAIRPKPPKGREPWANTVLYVPMTEDLLDHSWNNRTVTNNWVTISNKLWVFNWSSYLDLGNDSWTYNVNLNTISVWFKWNGGGSKDNCIIGKSEYYMRWHTYWQYQISIHEEDRHLTAWWMNGTDYNAHPLNFRTSSWGSPTLWPVAQANKWYHLVLTRDWNTKKAYIDWVLVATEDNTDNTNSNWNNKHLRIWSFERYNYDSYFNWNISRVILENKVRTAQEVLDYYNSTKSLYWIS